MRYTIPTTLLISLLMLGACSEPSRRYGNSSNTPSAMKNAGSAGNSSTADDPAGSGSPGDTKKGAAGGDTNNPNGAIPPK